jgi:hypothetical protein
LDVFPRKPFSFLSDNIFNNYSPHNAKKDTGHSCWRFQILNKPIINPKNWWKQCIDGCLATDVAKEEDIVSQ